MGLSLRSEYGDGVPIRRCIQDSAYSSTLVGSEVDDKSLIVSGGVFICAGGRRGFHA
jgi:hypothetical protein